MKAEIISIGDEITSGKILDTNSQWLAVRLGWLGVRTLFMTTVGDELPAMVDVFRTAVSRADVVIATGGLGPTADDLTRQTIAEMHHLPLRQDDTLLEYIRDLFRRRGREMPVANEIQAMLPEGARSIHNPNGTAPGIDLTVRRDPAERHADAGLIDRYRIFALPGVPAEMKEMYHGSVERELVAMTEEIAGQKRVIRARSLHCFGAGESQVEAMLPDIVNREKTPRVGITASHAVITLRIQAESDSEEGCRAQIEPMAALIRERLGTIVYGEGEDRLQDVVCRQLKSLGKTLAVCEVGTRGLLAESIAGGDEATDVFQGGIVLTGRPSPEEMLAKVRSVFTADFVLMIGAYHHREKTSIIIASPDGLEPLAVEDNSLAGHPALIDDLFTRRAMDLLRRYLQAGA